MKARRVAVIGLGAETPPPAARGSIARAGLVCGGRRQLEAARPWIRADARTLAIGGDLEPLYEAVAAADTPVVVLASGDPGFFGIVRALGIHVGRERLEVHPSVSSVQTAFARAAIHWDDALVVSAHGRDPRRAVNVCRAHRKVAVLTAPGFGPTELAGELADEGLRFLVAERLGASDERVVEGDAADIGTRHWRDPNIVVLWDPEWSPSKGWLSSPRSTPAGWALDEDRFERRGGMITKPEARAWALSRLGPGTGDLVWDIGTGSGSVACECARFGAAVIAVDRAPEACRLARDNARSLGVRVRVVEGEAPGALDGLPEPDAVFVGGASGPETLKMAASRARRTVVVALATVERVEETLSVLEAEDLTTEGILLEAARLRPLGSGHRLAPRNPVFLISGERDPDRGEGAQAP